MVIVLAGCTEQQPLASQEQAASAAAFIETTSSGAATARLIDATTSITVNLIDNRTGPTQSLYLYYEYTVADPASQVCNPYCYYTRYISDYGYGDIPASDGDVTPANARVATTTGDTFTTVHCVSENAGYRCGPGEPGATIDLRWERTGLLRTFTSGLYRATTAAFTLQTHGTYWSSYARITGTLLGHDLVTDGTLDDGQGSTITHALYANATP
jgi:hypothetical protein